MGGWKTSGMGVRHGPQGIRKYCKTQTIVFTRFFMKRELYYFPYAKRRSELLLKVVRFLYGRGTRDWDAAFLAADRKGDEKALAHQIEREAKRVKDTHPSLDLAAYSGTYSHPAYGPVTIALENGALVLHWQRINTALKHWQFDTFSAVDDANDLDEEVTFHLGDDGTVASFTLWGEDFARTAS